MLVFNDVCDSFVGNSRLNFLFVRKALDVCAVLSYNVPREEHVVAGLILPLSALLI